MPRIAVPTARPSNDRLERENSGMRTILSHLVGARRVWRENVCGESLPAGRSDREE